MNPRFELGDILQQHYKYLETGSFTTLDTLD